MTSNVVKAASPLASAVTGAMELSVAQWLLVVCLVAFPLLYEWSVSFKYFCKMAFYNGWILTLAILAIPICAVRGRNVENMKVLRFMLLHIKYLYGIKIEVRGWENFNIKEPYVVVSNHQSSLDLLDAAGEETLCDDPEAAERVFLEGELWREKLLALLFWSSLHSIKYFLLSLGYLWYARMCFVILVAFGKEYFFSQYLQIAALLSAEIALWKC